MGSFAEVEGSFEDPVSYSGREVESPASVT